MKVNVFRIHELHAFDEVTLWKTLDFIAQKKESFPVLRLYFFLAICAQHMHIPSIIGYPFKTCVKVKPLYPP